MIRFIKKILGFDTYDRPAAQVEPPKKTGTSQDAFKMVAEDIFSIAGRGIVVTGMISSGSVSVGDEVQLSSGGQASVSGIESFNQTKDNAQAGENVGLLFSELVESQITSGTVISKD